jgi:hypothetical protein
VPAGLPCRTGPHERPCPQSLLLHPAQHVRDGSLVDRPAQPVTELAVDLAGHGCRAERLGGGPELDHGADQPAPHQPAGGRDLDLDGGGLIGQGLLGEAQGGRRYLAEGFQALQDLLELGGVLGPLVPVLNFLVGVERLPFAVEIRPRFQIGQHFRDRQLRTHRNPLKIPQPPAT